MAVRPDSSGMGFMSSCIVSVAIVVVVMTATTKSLQTGEMKVVARLGNAFMDIVQDGVVMMLSSSVEIHSTVVDRGCNIHRY